MEIVLTNKEGEGFEAWRALVNKYESTSKASVVGKLAEILRTPFDGAQSHETISDSLKIGCVIAGVGQNSMKEHLLMSATKGDSWTNFVREIELIEYARKTITAPSPMDLDAFQGTVTSAGSMDTLRKNVGVRTMEEQRNLNVHNVETNIMDSVGEGVTHHSIKIYSKEEGKETEKETSREPRKVESSKVHGKGKGKGKKGQRLNEITEPPEKQWTGGSWEQIDTTSWRDDDWHTADSGSQTSATAEEFQSASIGDLPLEFVKHVESFQHD